MRYADLFGAAAGDPGGEPCGERRGHSRGGPERLRRTRGLRRHRQHDGRQPSDRDLLGGRAGRRVGRDGQRRVRDSPAGAEVQDREGNSIPSGRIGEFSVSAPQTFLVTNAKDGGQGLRRPPPRRPLTGRRRGSLHQCRVQHAPRHHPGEPSPARPRVRGRAYTDRPRRVPGDRPSDPSAAAFRILDSQAPTLTISGLTFTGGLAGGNGGVLLAGGTVALHGVRMVDNATSATTAGSGGAIAMRAGGFLRVTNSTISNNTAGLSGGGIAWAGGGGWSLLLENSTVSGNLTRFAGGYFGGGGVYFSGPSAPARRRASPRAPWSCVTARSPATPRPARAAASSWTSLPGNFGSRTAP